VPPSQALFTISEKELVQLPGYLEDRATELAEAKAMWQAGGGEALGAITIDIPGIWDRQYSGAGAIIAAQLTQNLGNEFVPKVETYTTITSKIVDLKYGSGNNALWYGWIAELSDVEPTDDFVQRYNSRQPIWKQFGVKDEQVDSLTDRLQVELDANKRAELLRQAVPLVIRKYGMGVPYTMVATTTALSWKYLRAGEASSFVTSHNAGRDCWLDQSDATWPGRPA
jgi:ABC-type transport system substrate-binding protein